MKIPIYSGFDVTKVIGCVELDEECLNNFPHLALSPSFIQKEDGSNELTGFGLVKAGHYIKAYEKYEKSI
jgi:hypothetical protein